MDGTNISISPSSPSQVLLPLGVFDPNDKASAEQNAALTRDQLTNTASLLATFFPSEWVAKATEMIKAHSQELTDGPIPRDVISTYYLVLNTSQPDRGARTMMGQDGSDKQLTFWLSDNAADNTQRTAVYVKVERDAVDKATVRPYDALFERYQEDPRRFYGMKRVKTDEFVVWRKKEVTVSGMKAIELPTEIMMAIFKIVLETKEKTDLIPTLMWCRLVNRRWHGIATELIFNPLTLSYYELSPFVNSIVNSIVNSPNEKLRPNIHTLVICHSGRECNGGKQGSRAIDTIIADTPPLEGRFCGLSYHEGNIVDLLAREPTLCAIKLRASSSNGKMRSLSRVVGWRQPGAAPESPDTLEKDLIRTLEKYVTEMNCPNFCKEKLPAKKFRWYWTIPLLFCLSAPSNELLDAIGKALYACIDLQKKIEKEHAIVPYVTFEVGRTWPYAEMVRWFQKEKGSLVGRWPIETGVDLVGRKEDVCERMQWKLYKEGIWKRAKT